MVIKEAWLLHLAVGGLVLNLTMIGWQLAHLPVTVKAAYPAKDTKAAGKIRKKLLENPPVNRLALTVNNEREVEALNGRNHSKTPTMLAARTASNSDGGKKTEESIQSNAAGLNPDCSLRETGCPNKQAARIEILRGLNLMIHPALWTEQSAVLDGGRLSYAGD